MAGIIVKRYCDRPMAIKKGAFKKRGTFFKCAKNCKTCICCIEVDEDGQKSYVTNKKRE